MPLKPGAGTADSVTVRMIDTRTGEGHSANFPTFRVGTAPPMPSAAAKPTNSAPSQAASAEVTQPRRGANEQ